jgi:hypothetical protein
MSAADRTGLLPRPKSIAGPGLGSLLWIRVLRALLWLLVVAGPVGAGVLAVQVSGLRHRVDLVSSQAVVQPPSDTAEAEGFAELFVAAFLDAEEDEPPAGLGSLDARSPRVVEPGSWSAARTVSLGAEEVALGYFAVTVAVHVPGRAPDSTDQPSWVPAGVRFYTVGVLETNSGWVTAGPPTLVAAPSVGSRPDLLVRRLDGLREEASLKEAVARFLAAYLTGQGELARYVAPGSALIPVQPPPFTTVEILDAGSVPLTDGTRQVVAVVQGTDGAGRVQVLQYALVAAQREGRWEVVELLPAPSLAITNDP